MSGQQQRTIHRFGDFTFDVSAGRLTRQGVDLRLAPQPLRLLQLLLERAGQLVTREEIRDVVWGERHVEFDQSLNFAIRKLREALADDDPAARMIETVPRRGYRFMATVSVSTPAMEARWTKRTVGGVLATAVVVLALIVVWPRPAPLSLGFGEIEGGSPDVAAPLASGLRTALAEIKGVRVVPFQGAEVRLTVRLEPAGAGTRVFAALRRRNKVEPEWRADVVLTKADLGQFASDMATDIAAAMHNLPAPGAAPVPGATATLLRGSRPPEQKAADSAARLPERK